MIEPALPVGNVAVTAPPLVSTKKPCPSTAVKSVVLTDPVCQSTVPVLPKPVCVAPQAKVTAVPGPPNVIVDPLSFSILFTLIVLVIIYF